MEKKLTEKAVSLCADGAQGENKKITCAACEEQFLKLFESHCCGFDTSALMCIGADERQSALRQIRLLSIIEAACMRLDQPIFTADRVFIELERLKEHPREAVRTAAQRALDLLNHLRRERLLEVYSYTENEKKRLSAEREMFLITMTVRSCSEKPVLVFTQDDALAVALVRQNQSLLVSGPRISAYRIADSGQPMRFIAAKE